MTAPQGPPCDLCGKEAAVMSVMNLTDYETLQIGLACLLSYFQGMVGMLSGAEGDTETPDTGGVPPQGPPAEQPPAARSGSPAASSGKTRPGQGHAGKAAS